MASSNIQKGKLDLPEDDGEERAKVEKKRRTPRPTVRLERAPTGGKFFSSDEVGANINEAVR